jgi:hypothetical protein
VIPSGALKYGIDALMLFRELRHPQSQTGRIAGQALRYVVVFASSGVTRSVQDAARRRSKLLLQQQGDALPLPVRMGRLIVPNTCQNGRRGYAPTSIWPGQLHCHLLLACWTHNPPAVPHRSVRHGVQCLQRVWSLTVIAAATCS